MKHAKNVFALLGLALACQTAPNAESGVEYRLISPEKSQPASDWGAISGRVDDLEGRATRLSNQWADVEREFSDARAAFDETQRTYQKAAQTSTGATETFRRAEADFMAAKTRWEYAQLLIVLAAAIDAANLDKFREASGLKRLSSVDCGDGASTSEYRRRLEARGEDLSGMDIDHIVPGSLGGADHPANYQVMSSGLNRSLGATWNPAKCRGAGLAICAAAMAVSKKCGSFAGPFF